MPLTEQEIIKDLSLELTDARVRGHSGQITVTVDLNGGNIARAQINRGRPIKAPVPTGNRVSREG